MADATTISVVICAFSDQRWPALQEAVAAVHSQTHPALETIIVIDHNPPLLARVREKFEDVAAVENSGPPGTSSARNQGVRLARGEVVAFIDDDARPEATWLQELFRAHSEMSILGVGGAIEPLWEGSRPTWFPDEFLWVVGCDYRGLPDRVAPIRNAIGANMTVERNAFLSVGGFREGFGKTGAKWGADETELCIRISHAHPSRQWLYWPDAKVKHRVPASRGTLRYFVTRCHQEGYVKAALTPIAGRDAGLSSERAYALRILPTGFINKIWTALARRNISFVAQACALLLGLAATTAGFAQGILAARIGGQRKS